MTACWQTVIWPRSTAGSTLTASISASWDRREPGSARAEIAFVVAHGLQHLGLGTLLLEHRAVTARRHSISTFSAETLASKQPMLAIFEHCGLPHETHWQAGEAEVLYSRTTIVAFSSRD